MNTKIGSLILGIFIIGIPATIAIEWSSKPWHYILIGILIGIFIGYWIADWFPFKKSSPTRHKRVKPQITDI